MQYGTRGSPGRRAIVSALTGVLIAAVVVAWERYETAEEPVETPVFMPPPAPADAEGEDEQRTVRATAPRRHSRPPDVVTRGRDRDEPEEQPAPEPVLHGTGEFVHAAGSSDVVGQGRVRRFIVEVEDGTRLDPEAVAQEIEAILFDERGWTADPSFAFQRVDEGPVDFRVTLASPDTVDRECLPLQTHGRFSCWNGERAMLNLWRWLEGAEAYGDDLDAYRQYLVTHEVGHALGYGHVGCPAAGEPAPTMMQQSIDVGACEPNPWPHPGG